MALIPEHAVIRKLTIFRFICPQWRIESEYYLGRSCAQHLSSRGILRIPRNSTIRRSFMFSIKLNRALCCSRSRYLPVEVV
jgi:hypothetical protein